MRGAGGVVGRSASLPGRHEHRVGKRGQVGVHVGVLLGAAAAHDDRDGGRLSLRVVLVPEVQALADKGPLVLAPRLLQAAMHENENGSLRQKNENGSLRSENMPACIVDVSVPPSSRAKYYRCTPPSWTRPHGSRRQIILQYIPPQDRDLSRSHGWAPAA